MEFFNSFLADKFAAVAAEIFQVFKDTIDTYKGEIELIKQENRKLKETLGHINNHIQEQTGKQTQRTWLIIQFCS